jgi:hypothetical protein
VTKDPLKLPLFDTLALSPEQRALLEKLKLPPEQRERWLKEFGPPGPNSEAPPVEAVAPPVPKGVKSKRGTQGALVKLFLIEHPMPASSSDEQVRRAMKPWIETKNTNTGSQLVIPSKSAIGRTRRPRPR